MKISVNNPKYNRLDIEAGYNIGGMSFLTGEPSSRGIYVYVTAASVSNKNGVSIKSFLPLDKGNFKIFVRPLNRKSQKQIAEVQAAIDALNQDTILTMYEAGRYKELALMLKEAA